MNEFCGGRKLEVARESSTGAELSLVILIKRLKFTTFMSSIFKKNVVLQSWQYL